MLSVILVTWNDTKYLIEQVRKSGFDKELSKLIKHKVYVGISAGSMILSEHIWMSSEFMYDEEEEPSPKGLHHIDIYFRPHYKSPDFPKVNDENLREIAKANQNKKIYAMDDDSALKIVDDKIEIISEGKWKLFPEE